MPQMSLQFEDLHSPTTPAEFFRESWEKTPLVIGRSVGDLYAGLLSLRDVDRNMAFSRPKSTGRSAFESVAAAGPNFGRCSREYPAISFADTRCTDGGWETLEATQPMRQPKVIVER